MRETACVVSFYGRRNIKVKEKKEIEQPLGMKFIYLHENYLLARACLKHARASFKMPDCTTYKFAFQALVT